MLLSLLKIAGHSMEPTIKNSSIVIVSNVPYLFLEPKIGDVVAFKNSKVILIKRIKKKEEEKFFVQGDNKEDSLEIGLIEKKDILGKLLFKF